MSTAIQKRPIDQLRVELLKPAFVGWLQKQMATTMNRQADQLVRIFLQACSQNDYMAKATPQSVLSSLCLAAQIGLVPNTALGHAWLVPFANSRPPEGGRGPWVKVVEAQLIIGYQGFVKLAYDAAGIVVQAHAVYQGDEFDYDLASFPPVKFHRRGPNRGQLTHAYCLGKTPQGLIFGGVLDRPEVEARRNVSKGYRDKDGNPRKDSPWVTHEAAMWMKSAVRDTLKLMPKGNDERMERAIDVDDMDTREQASVTALVDLSSAPIDMPQGETMDGSEPAALPPPSEDLQKWLMEMETATDLRSLDEVAAKARQALGKEASAPLDQPYLRHLDRVRGKRGA